MPSSEADGEVMDRLLLLIGRVDGEPTQLAVDARILLPGVVDVASVPNSTADVVLRRFSEGTQSWNCEWGLLASSAWGMFIVARGFSSLRIFNRVLKTYFLFLSSVEIGWSGDSLDRHVLAGNTLFNQFEIMLSTLMPFSEISCNV